MTIPYLDRLATIIRAGGGTVEDGRYVTRPGVIVMDVTTTTPEADALLDELGLDADLTGTARVAAFDGRLTYLHFPETTDRTGKEYLDGIVEGLGHTSVTARGYGSVLFAGMAFEDSMEFLAGRAGKSARLTSSDTKAQDETLYCLRGLPEKRAAQRRLVEGFLRLREEFSVEEIGGRYEFNQMNLGNRAALLHMGMCLEDWHGIFRGRLPKNGNEPGVREAFARACLLLHDRFPHVIRTPDAYGFQETLP